MQTSYEPTQIKPRKPLFALLMSFILPGFGQLYNGEWHKALWLFLLFALLSVPGVALVALYLPSSWMLPALLLSLLLTFILWIYSMADAWRGARSRQDYVPSAWQRSGVYVAVLLLCNGLALPLLINYVRAHQVEAFRLPSSSMAPTVLRNDFIFADKRYNCPGCKQAVKRGDIVIFTYPNDRTVYFIKRVIGLPGEHVQVNDNDILINGKSLKLQETSTPEGMQVTETDGARQWQVFWSKINTVLPKVDVTVPPGEVFLLGDNRNASHDSRFFGNVPLQDVVGKARQVWFSFTPTGVRWERMGAVLK